MVPELKKILSLFEEINTIPRKSKHEQRISDWLVTWAESHALDVKQDSALNVIISVPASTGCENDPIVILQGHMDMVCEKTPDSPHDFSKDAIQPVIDGDWMHADGTTLGADNGIGVAIALAIATDESVSHPPLELLFTSDEETGLNGANSITYDSLKGRILLNLDSEDEGVFTIGCAGGRDVTISLHCQKDTATTADVLFKIAADGLRGGHSGVDIHEQRANANILLARLLKQIVADIPSLQLSGIAGGSAHNAIPRNAYALVYVPETEQDTFNNNFNKTAADLQDQAKQSDPEAVISVTELPGQNALYTVEDTKKVIDLLNALPHGVAKMSEAIDGLVETSNNFATIACTNDTVTILSSQRSSVASELDAIVSRVESIAENAGASYSTNDGYPGWQPNPASPILALCKKVYAGQFGNEPRVEAIHAGLECGIIGAKFEDMDMISLGPTVKNPHSPDEKLFIPSVPRVWSFLRALLHAIK